MSERTENKVRRRSAIKVMGSIGAGAVSTEILGHTVNAAQFETATIQSSIPTEPEEEVYRKSAVNTEDNIGKFHSSNSMYWFRSFSTGDGTFIHDFSVSCSAASEHPSYEGVLTDKVNGWGYRVQGPEGNISPNSNEDMHGAYPEGDSGPIPEWTRIVMEGALTAIALPLSVLKTAMELQDLMEPADGFDFSVNDGFAWRETRRFGGNKEKQTHNHHRIFYESESTIPKIKIRTSNRTLHRPFRRDKWLHLDVETLGSWPTSREYVHPKEMDAQVREALGVREIKNGDKKGGQFAEYERILGKEINTKYILTNCPWSGAEVKITQNWEDLGSTTKRAG